jgi:hypothetical protein
MKPHPAFGGSLSWKTTSHTFLASYNRAASDSYGIGAVTNSGSEAGWRWRRRGSAWWLESAVNWEQLYGVGQDTSGWRTTAGIGRAMSARAALLTQYVYLNYSGPFRTTAGDLSQSAVRVSIVWALNP